ncbi:Arf-GAP with coiled-coil, ANK repeat and PH domain-containing protein 2 [Homalodisca vitripennis]|nr:Arf-GAP with coiled-coil, ANK repeat and PH domain-containing protein 2 [Homalodisca vitripennis]
MLRRDLDDWLSQRSSFILRAWVIKACGTMVDTGKTYVSQQSQLANCLWDLSVCFHDDPDTTSKLNRLIHSLQEMNKFHTILLDQASRTILKNLTSFVKEANKHLTSRKATGRLSVRQYMLLALGETMNFRPPAILSLEQEPDIKAARESRHYLEKVSSELDAALQRNSSAVRSRPLETEEANNLLAATRACFRHTALSHVHCVTMLQAHKQHELVSTLLSYMHACTTYFHQGYDLCEGLQPFFKSVSDDLEIQRAEAAKLEKTLNNCHTLVTSQDVVQPAAPALPSTGPPHMEGYLFKRTSNAFKTWNRRWFYLDNNQLVYRKRTGEDSVTVMEDDLRLCSVKPVVDSERRFCFEVLSPTKSHMLQADSEDMYQAWVNALQLAIGAALQHSHGHTDNRQQTDRQQTDSQDKLRKSKIWEQLVKVAGNDKCCDCGDPDPKWASINLGITLCIACSGVHRSLGVHYSKVRSLTLDAWEPEILKVMAELGNCVVNNIYEANIDPDVTRATPSCVGGVREAYIKAKWVERKFVRPLAVSPARLSRSPALRKWSVRKLRRRPHSSDTSKRRTKLNCVHDKPEEPEQKNASVSVSEEVILIGENLPGKEAQSSIELSSDEDSAGDEEEGEAVSSSPLCTKSSKLLLLSQLPSSGIPIQSSCQLSLSLTIELAVLLSTSSCQLSLSLPIELAVLLSTSSCQLSLSLTIELAVLLSTVSKPSLLSLQSSCQLSLSLTIELASSCQLSLSLPIELASSCQLSLSLTIELAVLCQLSLSLTIELASSCQLSLSLPIELAVLQLSLSLPIELASSCQLSLSLPIELAVLLSTSSCQLSLSLPIELAVLLSTSSCQLSLSLTIELAVLLSTSSCQLSLSLPIELAVLLSTSSCQLSLSLTIELAVLLSTVSKPSIELAVLLSTVSKPSIELASSYQLSLSLPIELAVLLSTVSASCRNLSTKVTFLCTMQNINHLINNYVFSFMVDTAFGWRGEEVRPYVRNRIVRLILKITYDYCASNDLAANHPETKQINFGRRGQHIPALPDVLLEEESKLLVLTLDAKLMWRPHINELCKDMFSAVIVAYHALLESHIRYGIVIWVPPLKAAIRSLAELEWRESYREAFKKLKIDCRHYLHQRSKSWLKKLAFPEKLKILGTKQRIEQESLSPKTTYQPPTR